jgi:hypothetical protein
VQVKQRGEPAKWPGRMTMGMVGVG